MRSRTRILADERLRAFPPAEDLSQTLNVEWKPAALELPPENVPLYVCYNHIEKEDQLHVRTMLVTILENCRYVKDREWDQLADEKYERWEYIPKPDYWAIKEFPRPPIGF